MTESLLRIIILCGKQGLALRGHRDHRIYLSAERSNEGNFIELVTGPTSCHLPAVGEQLRKRRVVEALKKNGYPTGFIHRYSNVEPGRESASRSRPKTSLTVPYISGLSETLRRILLPLIIKVIFSPLYTLRRRLVHPKNPIPSNQHKGIVYQIPCSDCNKVYIGQSGRCLNHRLPEHRRAIRNGNVTASALAEHVWSTGHYVDLSSAEVIDSNPYVTTRCLLESWHIQNHPNTLNREKGTLPLEYKALLN